MSGALIPLTHSHHFSLVNRFVEQDGSIVETSICSDQENCGLQEKRYLEPDGTLRGVLYRLRGVWVHPLDLFRILPLPVEPCPVCLGAPGTVEVCERCGNAGIVERERPAPALFDVSDPDPGDTG